MTSRRVVITGLGVVTPGALGIAELFAGLLACRQNVQRIDLFDPSGFPCRIGGQLNNFSAKDFVPKSYRKAVKVMARDTEIAVAAADLAVRDAGIITAGLEGTPDVDPGRFGCNIGAGLICVDLDELGMAVQTATKDGRFDLKLWGEVGMKNLTPLWLLKYLPNMLSCHVTIIHGAKGPSNTITCTEAAGLLSVGEAARTIQRDSADLSIAGGAESKLNPMGLLRQGKLNRLTTANDDPANACRPFDVGHSGTVIGEGGGLLILEERSRAEARKARIYAELAGFGAGCDPDGVLYMDKPGAGGLAGAIAMALADAGITPADVDLVIPQGNAVPAEDVAEAQALREALGDQAGRIPVVPLNGGIGNLFAGSGAVNLAVSAMALHKQTVPPAVNCVKVDPACGLNVPSAGIPRPLRYALTAGYAIGGQAAAIVLKRYE